MASETKHMDRTPIVPKLSSSPNSAVHKMQNLNDRLACYINRVRDLEAKNARFGTKTRGKSTIKQIFKSGSADVGKTLNKIDTKRLLADYANLKICLEKKTNELNAAHLSVQGYNDWQIKYHSAIAKNKGLENEIFKLKAELNDLHKNWEEKTLAPVKVESDGNLGFLTKSDKRLSEQYDDQMKANRIEDLTSDEAVIKNDRASEPGSVANHQVCTTRNQISLLTNEIVKLQSLAFTYLAQIRDLEDLVDNETQLRADDAIEIHRLHKEMAQQLREFRNFMNIKMSLKLKIATDAKLLADEKKCVNIPNQSSHFSQSLQRSGNATCGMALRHRKRPFLYESDASSTGGQVESRESHPARKYVKLLNNGRIEVAESTGGDSPHIADIKDLLNNQIQVRTESKNKIRRLHDEMLQKLHEYQVLMDLKMSLDLEIGMYDKLLTEEKVRLNFSSISNRLNRKYWQSFKRSGKATSVARGTVSRIGRRKSTSGDQTDDITMADCFVLSKGNIEIQESCPEGKYVKLFNKSDAVTGIGDWQLIRASDENETAFKFHHAVKIGPKECITVWSADTSTVHQPPAHIVMKDNWLTGKLIKTQLIKADGVVVATHERTPTLTTHFQKDVNNYQSDSQTNTKCSIM